MTLQCIAVVIVVITQAYDEHLNLLLSEVQETVTTTEVDEETYEEIVKVHSSIVASTTHSPMFPRKHTIIHFHFPSCTHAMSSLFSFFRRTSGLWTCCSFVAMLSF